jgi:hypothetical protein
MSKSEIKENREISFFYETYDGDKCMLHDQNKIIILHNKKKFYVTYESDFYHITNADDVVISSLKFTNEENDFGKCEYMLVASVIENYALLQQIMMNFKMDYSIIPLEYGAKINSFLIHRMEDYSYIWLNTNSEKYLILDEKYNPPDSRNTIVAYFYKKFPNTARKYRDYVNFYISCRDKQYYVKFINGNFDIFLLSGGRELKIMTLIIDEVKMNKFAILQYTVDSEDSFVERLIYNLKLDYYFLPEKKLLPSFTTYQIGDKYIMFYTLGENYQDLIDKFKKTMENQEKYKIENEYNQVKNIDNVKIMIDSHTLDSKINDFKDRFTKSITDFPDLLYNPEIKSINKTIADSVNRTKDMLLFSEPYKLQSRINPVEKLYLAEKFTDIVVFQKNSASLSFVFKAKYLSKPCFIKCFFNSTQTSTLVFEQKIYSYIKNRNEKIKKYYEEYFVKVYDLFVTNAQNFLEILDEFGVTIGDTGVSWREYVTNTASKNLYEIFQDRSFHDLYFIVTEDIEGETYREFQKKNFYNEQISTSTLFDICYGFYLLNYKLCILHGDNHFSNILIKDKLPEHDAKYIIEKVEYTRKKNYRICIYDFDRCVYNFDRPHSPSLYYQDIWTIALLTPFYALYGYSISGGTGGISNRLLLQRLTYTYVRASKEDLEKFNHELAYLEHIVVNIFLNNNPYLLAKYRTKYVLNNTRRIQINNFREELVPESEVLNWINILERFIFDPRTKLSINILEVNPFYKKYLKYKEKYIQLKNKQLSNDKLKQIK